MLHRRVDDEVLIALPNDDDLFQLSATAAHVFGLLEKPWPLHALVAFLAHEFKVPESTVSADLKELLERLEERQVIRVIELGD